VRITATNSAGTGEQSYTLEVYKTPILAAVPNQRIGPNKAFWYQTTVDARPNPTFAINAGPSGLTIDPASGMINWTPTDQQLGTHTVLFEASNRFGKHQQSFEIEVDATVGIDRDPQPFAFRLISQYPQPASASLSLGVIFGSAPNLDIEIFDALGRLRSTRSESALPGTRMTIELRTADLKPGLYFYRIRGGAEQTMHSFIVAR
jgi:hypothetical protein